ncbi:MAG: hypothetical protein P1U53_04055 [Sulfitobacter sp.]|nr:hypothetical protein [Sulfitobacter sp.]
MSPKAGWPVWETDAAAGTRIGWKSWSAAGLLAAFLPPLLASPLLLFFRLLGESGHLFLQNLVIFPIMAIYSAAFAWIGLIPGVFLARYAARRGKAGWGTALLSGALLPGLFNFLTGGLLGGAVLTYSVFGMVYAGALWLVMRWLCPAAFVTAK